MPNLSALWLLGPALKKNLKNECKTQGKFY